MQADPVTKVTIGEARRQRRLTQQRLANETGLSIATVQQGEAGKRLSHASLQKIARALGVSVESLS